MREKKTARETLKSWEGFSMQDKIIDVCLSSISLGQGQKVGKGRGNHFRDRLILWTIMDQASGRVHMLYDAHALFMSCPHSEEYLKPL